MQRSSRSRHAACRDKDRRGQVAISKRRADCAPPLIASVRQPEGAVLTFRRYSVTMSAMSTPKRATVYFEADVHRAQRLRAAANERSMSDMVNDAVKAALAEDAVDLEAFDKRRKERSTPFESFVRGMKRRGRL